MNINTVEVPNQKKIKKINNHLYNSNTIKTSSVVEGAFYQVKPITIREMVTRKINKSLSFCLILTIIVTFISYYVAMNYEAKLNKLDREIVRINVENQDLQADLDRYKSFNNVDNKIGELQLLQKAEKVIEVTAMNNKNYAGRSEDKQASNKFNWIIGY